MVAFTSGSTFTQYETSGSYNIEYFTPILNTPEVGILGVGAIQKELVLEDGEVVEKLKLPLSLTYDHQIIDGVPAAEFLSKIANYLQEPYRLLLLKHYEHIMSYFENLNAYDDWLDYRSAKKYKDARFISNSSL